MCDLPASWVSVGQRTFQRTEISSSDWVAQLTADGRVEPDFVVPSPFGGPVIVVQDHAVRIHQASGGKGNELNLQSVIIFFNWGSF